MDSRIDVFGKAFLGLTVACAKCHDHKFDPIPTSDYYSLGGIFESTQLLLGSIESPGERREAEAVHRRLAETNEQIRALFEGSRPARAASLRQELVSAALKEPKATAQDAGHPYYPLMKLAGVPAAEFPVRLAAVRSELEAYAAKAAASSGDNGEVVFDDFEKPTFEGWHVNGLAFGGGPMRSVAPNQSFAGSLSGMANSFRGGSDKLTGTLMSRSFRPTKKYIHVRLAGTRFSPVREHPSLLGVTIFATGRYPKAVSGDGDGVLKWKTITLLEEIGQVCNLEIADRRTDGHVVVDKIVFSDSKTPPLDPPDPRVLAALASPNLQSADDLAAAYERLFLDSPDLARAPNESLESAAALLAEADRTRLKELQRERATLEAALPTEPFGMLAAEDNPRNLRIFVRGNHLDPGDEAPRGFLRVLAKDQPDSLQGSGRLELADMLFRADNPLTARVMVNRIWQHHFGEGMVRTVDNFGKNGDRPSHPELLDYLAARFRDNGWSIKAMHREIVLSSAYRMSSVAGERAREVRSG